MSWYFELVEMYEHHLRDEHIMDLSVREETEFMIDHLEYDKFSPGIHQISCCQVNCKWHQTFEISYALKMAIKED